MPSGKTACPHITDNKDGTITIKYQPTERGLHEMDIKYDGNHIPGQLCTMMEVVCLPFLNLISYLKINQTPVKTTVSLITCFPMFIFSPGSPLQFYVDAVNSGVVTAYGPGLSYGTVNKAATFTVVTKNAGEGQHNTLYCFFFFFSQIVFSVKQLKIKTHTPSVSQVVCH